MDHDIERELEEYRRLKKREYRLEWEARYSEIHGMSSKRKRYQENREEINRKRRERYAKDPVYRAKNNAQSREYRRRKKHE